MPPHIATSIGSDSQPTHAISSFIFEISLIDLSRVITAISELPDWYPLARIAEGGAPNSHFFSILLSFESSNNKDRDSVPIRIRVE